MSAGQSSVVGRQSLDADGLRALPDGWVWKTLRDVLSTTESGGRPKGGARGIADGIPSLGGEHLLYSGGFDFREIRYIPNDYYAKMTRGKIRKHDVLVVKDGATTGKTSFVGDDFPFANAAVNEHVFILRPAETLLSKYLFYWFQSPFGQYCVGDNFRGAAQGGITLGILDNSRFPLAPLHEQERIVARLEELLSDLDAGVAALARVRAGLKRYKDSVLKAACGGKLFESRGTENRENGLPEGWRWVKLPELGLLARGKSKHRPRNAEILYGGPYPFIQTGDIRHADGCITKYTQTYSEAGLAQSKLWPKGTLCITIAANIAETAILGFDSCFPDSVVGFVPNDNVDVKFVEFYFRTIKESLERFAPATAQKNINLDVLQKVLVALPPLEEQWRIVAEVERRLESARAVEAAVEAGLKRAARLRQAVLRSAFEGRL